MALLLSPLFGASAPAAQAAQAAQGADAAAPVAYASTQRVTLDGLPTDFAMYALADETGELTHYIRVRDLAAALARSPARFDVGYDGGVVLFPGRDYTPLGTEWTTPFAGDRSCSLPTAPTVVDGAPAALGAILLTDDNGGGYTYYKLRDLAGALGFRVDWSASGGISLYTTPAVDYADSANWAYRESDAADKAVDVFFVCPTVYGGGAGEYNMALDDDEAKAAFVGATNMEKGIYDDNARFFAPYYRQAGLAVYAMEDEAGRAPWLSYAYCDIKDAFAWYLAHENQGRGVVLCGFSQGGDLCLRLAEDFFGADASRLVACYAIGWRVEEDDLARYPALSFAAGEADVGVVVSFNSEAPEVDASLCIPTGTRSLAINPLSWKTDSAEADKGLNKGACFPDYSGDIVREVPALTGAYIDPARGALKVTGVTAEDFPPVLDIFAPGVYHLYDYQFFYRNLEENVQTRIAAWRDNGGS